MVQWVLLGKSAETPRKPQVKNMHSSHRPPAWLMLTTGMMVTLVVLVFARLAFGFILPQMRESLGLTYQQAGNLGTGAALGYLCLVMVAGAAAARWGGRLAVLIGLGLATFGFLGLTFASHYWALLVFMMLLGFGTAFGYTPLISLLGTWFPERRGAVIGLLGSGVGVGILIAGFLVPCLAEAFGEKGWRITWGIFAATGALTGVAALAFLRDPPLPVGSEGKSSEPLNKWTVYGNRHVVIAGLIYGIIGLTYIIQAIFMFSFALESGLSQLTAGKLAALMGLLSIVFSPCWGWLSDRMGRSSALLLSMALTLLGTVCPVVWQNFGGFAAHYLILGVALNGLFTAILAASTEQVEERAAPLAVSYVTFFFAGGQLIGPAAAGVLIEWSGGFRWIFAGTSVILAIGLGLAWQLHSLRHRAWAQESPSVQQGQPSGCGLVE